MKLPAVLLAGALAVSTPLPAETPHWPKPLSGYAPDLPVCIAIYHRNSDQYLAHGLEQCQERLAPCSTFKIPNALIGLETGVLTGPSDLKTWDGTQHDRKVLNQDHHLANAIRHSIVWYFQDVALDIGAERMQAWLDEFDYGNRDISGGQDQFWLSSSLKISAFEQIRFMTALSAGELPAGRENQKTVKSMMLQDYALPEGFRGEFYGKTGSCFYPGDDHGWFTGFMERDGQKYVFAVNIKGESQGGPQARAVAVDVMNEIR